MHLLWCQAKPSHSSSKQEATAELGDTKAPHATCSASSCCRHSWQQLERGEQLCLGRTEPGLHLPGHQRKGSTRRMVCIADEGLQQKKSGLVYSIMAKTWECSIYLLNHGPLETKLHLVRSKSNSRYYQTDPAGLKVQFIPVGPETAALLEASSTRILPRP